VSYVGISARDLHRVVMHLVEAATEGDEGDEGITSQERREALADLAGQHDLTLHEFITVLRVASGERPEDSPK